MMKKIEIEKVLVKSQDIFGLKQIRTIDAKQRAFTDFFFWNQVGGRDCICSWWYRIKIFVELLSEKYFEDLCNLYGIKIICMEKVSIESMKIHTDSSILSTYLNETERKLLRTMGHIGLNIITGVKTSYPVNSSFEKSVWIALGYKFEDNLFIL